MGYIPIVDPRFLPLEARISPLELAASRRRSRLPWRRRAALDAVRELIRLREHALFGEHEIRHAGACPRGVGVCGPKPPPKPLKAAAPSYRDV